MPTLLTGSDILARGKFRRLAGLTIGFVGNHTSRLADGSPTHDAIARAGVCKLAKLFSPEHGAFGLEDHEKVADSGDPITGLRITSLYGSVRKPAPEMLAGLDALVFELQDVGARFYTYAATMLLCLEAAAEASIPLIVLDRPNPLGGPVSAEGPLPDPDKHSFVVSSAIPVRHGLTLGEIARIAQRERGMADECLEIIPCENYSRNQWWDQTGRPWVAPSPAMRSLDAATVYPGVCLLEQTNVSVGRGTSEPFLVAGAPWADGMKWAEFINEECGNAVLATPHLFTPTGSLHAGESCSGVRLSTRDRNSLASVRLGIAMAAGLLLLHPDQFAVEGITTLLASDDTLARIKRGEPVGETCASWQPALNAWRARVADLLLYPNDQA